MRRRGITSRGAALDFAVARFLTRDEGAKKRLIETLTRNTRRVGDCHLWVGGHVGGKYGNTYPRLGLRLKGKKVNIYVHRLSLVMQLGRAIRVGMEAGHTCGNASCIRHVTEQTPKHNMSLRTFRGKKTETTAESCPF